MKREFNLTFATSKCMHIEITIYFIKCHKLDRILISVNCFSGYIIIVRTPFLVLYVTKSAIVTIKAVYQ